MTELHKITLCVSFFLLAVGLQAQTNSENYSKSTVYRQGTTTGSVPINQKVETVNYSDGLGRPSQVINAKAGGNKENIIQHIGYDGLGRTDKQYLPYATSSEITTGYLNKIPASSVLSLQESYNVSKYPSDFISGVQNTYNETLLENSPLSRPREQGAAGANWNVNPSSDTDHTVKYEYKVVSSGDQVSKFKVEHTNGDIKRPELVKVGEYVAGDLYRTIMKDENWSPSDGVNRTTEEFMDKFGQVVLKRTYVSGDQVNTYYVYDDFGNLTYVLSPNSEETLLSSGSFSIDGKSIYTPPRTRPPFVDNGQVTMSLDEDGILTVDVNLTSGGGYGPSLRTGQIARIPFAIPNVYIGNIQGYTFRIIDNYFVIQGFGSVSSHDQSYVVDTGAGANINQNVLNDLCYQYIYDERYRLIEKKIPGKGWEFIVYDRLDRPIMTQDANLKLSKKWLYTKYDIFGRVVYTGIATINSSRATCQTRADNTSLYPLTYEEKLSNSQTIGDSPNVFYTSQSYPNVIDITEVHNINYYDDYNFDTNYNNGLTSNPLSLNSYSQPNQTNLKGLPTGSKTRVLDTDDWIISYIVYDTKSRPIYTASHNKYLNTTNTSKMKLGFDGSILESDANHTKSGANIRIRDYYTYDHQARLTLHRQRINNQPYQRISENHYDEIGQLEKKDVGGLASASQPLQEVDYEYNVRGWLKKINDVDVAPSTSGDLFNFEINYDDLPSSNGSTATSLYNGNISRTVWRTGNSYNQKKAYYYSYDELNRIKQAKGRKGNTLTSNDDYDLSSISYDKNGNILSLVRKGHINAAATGFGTMDNLVYTYSSGNQLKKVQDNANDLFGFIDPINTTTEYYYDSNGNLTKDRNKGIDKVSYNHFNLPKQVVMNPSGTVNDGTISYIYDASGSKLKKTINPNNTTTDDVTLYDGGFVYEQNSLKMFPQAEGYVEPAFGGTYNYVFQYTDHLGNVRVSYAENNDNGIAAIKDERNYYPFGLEHKGYNTTVVGNQNDHLTYNGKEFEQGLGLNIYEMDMRQLDPALGRWMSIDPVTHHSQSPYNAFDNNPLYWADPSGADSEGADGLTNSEWLSSSRPGDDAWDSNGMANQNDGSNETNEEEDSDKNTNNSEEVKCCQWFWDWLDGLTGATDWDFGVDDEDSSLLRWYGDDGFYYVVAPDGSFWKVGFRQYTQVDELPPTGMYPGLNMVGGPGTAKSVGGIIMAGSKSKGTVAYIAKSATGKIIYAGITNNFAVRAANHLRKKGIRIEEIPGLSNLSRYDARAVEQVLIETFGLGGKIGQKGQLLNRINSIAEKNPIYAESLKRGYELLQKVGMN